MPSWLITWLLPTFGPYIGQLLGPVVVEYAKKTADYLNMHLSRGVTASLAAVVAVGINEAMKTLTGGSLPPILEYFVPVIGIALKEFGKDLGQEPPTPGAPK